LTELIMTALLKARKRNLAGRLGMLLALVAMCEAARPRPLGDELSFALERNPRLRAASQGLLAAREDVAASRSVFLPQVSVSGDVGPEHIDNPSASFTRGTSEYVRETAGLTVTQNVFSGYRNSASLAIAEVDEEIAALDFRMATQSILLDGYSAYLAVLSHGELVGLATENQQTIRRQMGLEDERVSRGSGVAVDVLLAKARLQLAGEVLVTHRGALRDAETRYRELIGRSPLVGQMSYPEIPPGTVPEKLEDAVETALDESVERLVTLQRLERARQERRIAAASKWPRVNLVGRAGYEEDVNAIKGTRRTNSVLLTAYWELFSGFRSRSAVSAADARYRQARFTEEEIRRQVREQVSRAFHARETALERVALLKNAGVLAEEVFDARTKSYDAGGATAITVLDARSQVFNTRMSLVSARLEADLATLRLLFAIGRLTPEAIGLESPLGAAPHD